MRTARIVILPVLLIAGCSGARRGHGTTDGSPHDTRQVPSSAESHFGADSLRASLHEADREFARAAAEGRVEGWVSAFSSNGVMVSGGRTFGGLDEIRELMGPVFDDSTYSLSWDPHFAAASVAGDLGYTIGRYESRRRSADGRERASTGTYLTVWRRQADGSWKVEADIGSPSPD